MVTQEGKPGRDEFCMKAEAEMRGHGPVGRFEKKGWGQAPEGEDSGKETASRILGPCRTHGFLPWELPMTLNTSEELL